MVKKYLREIGEEGLIRWIADHNPDLPAGVLLGIGDDAAALDFSPGTTVVVSTDTVVEGIHFRKNYCTPEQAGRKVVAVNLSDMAAMGAEGRFILLTIGLPEDTEFQFFEGVLQGIIDYSARNGLALVGGDLTATRGPIFLALTILGETERDKIMTRRGAEPGDILVISGQPGESTAGLLLLERGLMPDDPAFGRVIQRHLEPEPRLEVSRLAVSSGVVSAAIDLSDGLSTDLSHICVASGVRAAVDASLLPLSNVLKRAAAELSVDPLDLIVNGGEDYELLLAVRPDGVKNLIEKSLSIGQQLTVIGRFVKGKPRAFLIRQGRTLPLPPRGFDHFSGTGSPKR